MWLDAPSALCGSPVVAEGRTGSPLQPARPFTHWPRRCYSRLRACRFRLDWLTSQARSVRGHLSRRAMHASGESPWHLSAKHCFLETCLPLTAPFRAMLLTLMSGHQRLGSRAHRVPVYPMAFLHSYFALSRRTVKWWSLVRMSVRPSRRITCIEIQSVRLYPLSGRDS